MKIINNFSSQKHTSLSSFDILIWYVSLLHAKKLGYQTKLYCEEKDFRFLKDWGLFDLYDEIDSSFISSSPVLATINNTCFWSSRKLECIGHEFEVSSEPFLYTDVDVILDRPLPLDYDLLAWCPEDRPNLYLPWKHFSTPAGYEMPSFLQKVDKVSKALNCGVLYFRTKEMFDLYHKAYLSFTLNNPCQFIDLPADSEGQRRDLWACNAEQRILYALVEDRDWNAGCCTFDMDLGLSDVGTHYFSFRTVWRGLFDEKAPLTEEARTASSYTLSSLIALLLRSLDKEALNRFLKIPSFAKLWQEQIPIGC